MEFQVKADAEEAIRELQGKELIGDPLVIEWSKREKKSGRDSRSNACFKCDRRGHWTRDCPENRDGRDHRHNRER